MEHDRHSPTASSDDEKGLDVEVKESASVDQFDPVEYYENNTGRIVVDPEYVLVLRRHPAKSITDNGVMNEQGSQDRIRRSRSEDVEALI